VTSRSAPPWAVVSGVTTDTGYASDDGITKESDAVHQRHGYAGLVWCSCTWTERRQPCPERRIARLRDWTMTTPGTPLTEGSYCVPADATVSMSYGDTSPDYTAVVDLTPE